MIGSRRNNVWTAGSGSTLTGLNIMNAIVIEVFYYNLGCKAYDDSGDDDDNSDNDDDGEVEEVVDVCLLDAGAPQLRWVEDSAFNHA